jgi:hypothetical protein
LLIMHCIHRLLIVTNHSYSKYLLIHHNQQILTVRVPTATSTSSTGSASTELTYHQTDYPKHPLGTAQAVPQAPPRRPKAAPH